MLYSLIIYFLVIGKKTYFFYFNVSRFFSLFIFLGELINYPKVKNQNNYFIQIVCFKFYF